MKILCVAFGAIVLSACAGPQQASPQIQAAALEPLYCQGADQCSRYWRRAQIWVTNNSKWKIQTVTDSIIVTFTPSESAVQRGFKITREPLSGGREQIRIASGCNNMFGCNTDEHATALAFKTYVKAD